MCDGFMKDSSGASVIKVSCVRVTAYVLAGQYGLRAAGHLRRYRKGREIR
jgi:hypothetical protein